MMQFFLRAYRYRVLALERIAWSCLTEVQCVTHPHEPSDMQRALTYALIRFKLKEGGCVRLKRIAASRYPIHDPQLFPSPCLGASFHASILLVTWSLKQEDGPVASPSREFIGHDQRLA